MIETLRARFEENGQRHAGIEWSEVASRLTDTALKALVAMETSGGEPDVIGQEGDQFLFVDCAAESPKGRRSLCYDRAALDARKENKPAGSAMEMAAMMGVELLSEDQYRRLQELGEFDLKTSSWVLTEPDVRRLGGSLFGDRRYDRVFIFHNGADSYYASRGFRGILRV